MAAGLIRRGLAFWLDVFVAVLPLALALAFFGSLVPLDDHLSAFAAILIPGVIGALGYVFAGAGVFENTIGRYLVGVRVRDLKGGRPSLRQAFARSLTLGLWPIEALMVAFGKQRRRLGDRLASTMVERYQPPRSPLSRAGLALVVAVPGFLVMFGAAPLINARMSISRAAQAYVAEREGIELPTPRTVRVVNDIGAVTFRVSDQRGLQLELERVGGNWTVLRASEIRPEQIGWWSYSVEVSK